MVYISLHYYYCISLGCGPLFPNLPIFSSLVIILSLWSPWLEVYFLKFAKSVPATCCDRLWVSLIRYKHPKFWHDLSLNNDWHCKCFSNANNFENYFTVRDNMQRENQVGKHCTMGMFFPLHVRLFETPINVRYLQFSFSWLLCRYWWCFRCVLMRILYLQPQVPLHATIFFVTAVFGFHSWFEHSPQPYPYFNRPFLHYGPSPSHFPRRHFPAWTMDTLDMSRADDSLRQFGLVCGRQPIPLSIPPRSLFDAYRSAILFSVSENNFCLLCAGRCFRVRIWPLVWCCVRFFFWNHSWDHARTPPPPLSRLSLNWIFYFITVPVSSTWPAPPPVCLSS